MTWLRRLQWLRNFLEKNKKINKTSATILLVKCLVIFFYFPEKKVVKKKWLRWLRWLQWLRISEFNKLEFCLLSSEFLNFSALHIIFSPIDLLY